MKNDLQLPIPHCASSRDTLLDSSVISHPSRQSKIKMVVTNNLLGVYKLERPVFLGRGKQRSNRICSPKQQEEKSSRFDEYKKRSGTKALNTVRNLAVGNFSLSDDSKFITLTFNNENDFDINDPFECNKKFTIFMKRIRRRYKNIRYIVVVEFQKRGAVHYHLLTDLPYIEKSELSEIWEYGFIDIRAIRSAEEIGRYISKYFTKNINDPRLKGARLYHTSKNLIRSKIFYFEKANDIQDYILKNKLTPNFQKPYDSELNGKIYYEEYILDYPLLQKL